MWTPTWKQSRQHEKHLSAEHFTPKKTKTNTVNSHYYQKRLKINAFSEGTAIHSDEFYLLSRGFAK
jgi:hypothetical protein